MRTTHFIPKPDRVVFAVIGIFCFLSLLISSCNSDSLNLEKGEPTKPVFTKKNEAFGRATYEALIKTVQQASIEDIDLADKKAIERLAYEHSLDALREESLMDESEYLTAKRQTYDEVVLGSVASDQASKDALKKKAPSPAAKKIMAKIQEAINSSKTYKAFSSKLAGINDELPFTVPAKEQESLQRGIAILHYSLKAIDFLDGKGLLKDKSVKQQTVEKAGFGLLAMGLGYKEGDGWGWWDDWGRCAAISALVGVSLALQQE